MSRDIKTSSVDSAMASRDLPIPAPLTCPRKLPRSAVAILESEASTVSLGHHYPHLESKGLRMVGVTSPETLRTGGEGRGLVE